MQNTTDDSNRLTIKIDERDSYPAPPTLSTKEWTFETAIQQLEYCEYEAIGGKLIWNDAFIWLKNKHRSDVEKLEADHKKQIATLEAQVKEKDDQIEAALFSGTQGEIIRTQKEQIATLTAELTEVKQRRESAWERIDELGNQVIDLSFKLKEMEAKNG